jgi:phytoene desaturase
MGQARKIAVVGAGVGGLATACRLSQKGYPVEVFEKLAECGGRNHLLEDKGFKFDMGPSFVLMPDFFEEIFSACGENLNDYLRLQVLDPSYKIFYADSDSFTVFRDSIRTQAEVERIEAGAGKKFNQFIAEISGIYRAVRPLLYKCFTPLSILNPAYFSLLTKLHPFQSYWQLAKKYFNSDKLAYAFTFEAMFIGVSPFAAPAFYSVISYADHVQKVFHPLGVMYEIPKALEKIAKKYGAKINYSSEVKKIFRKDREIVLQTDNNILKYDQVVINADYPYAQSDLLQRKLPNYKYSCSVYLLYLGLKRKVAGVAHHNLFFGKDLIRNLDQIFKYRNMPEDPSFYLHVPTVTDPSLAPPGKDLFYILIPVPNLEEPGEKIQGREETLRKFVFNKINTTLGIKLEELIEVEHRFYPEDFVRKYNLKYGATFGLAHNLWQSAFFRPANFDPKIKGLYYVGASTQPGGGLPVVMASSRIVADLIAKDTRP